MSSRTSCTPALGDAAPAGQEALPSVALPPELNRVFRDYEQAWLAHDADALAALFAEDGFVLSNNRPAVGGRAGIRLAYATSGVGRSLRALSFSVADTIGYVIGVFSPHAGQPDVGKFVLALRRDAGGPWQIAPDMDNGIRR